MAQKNQYALTIGIGQRNDDSPAMAVTSKDASRVAKELATLCGVAPSNIIQLLENNATKKNIIDSLELLITNTTQNQTDCVWIYFSGHGSKISIKNVDKYFLITRDASIDDIEKTAISGLEFTSLLNRINTKKMLLLLDCCHAGGINLPKVDIPFFTNSILGKSNRVVISACHHSQEAFPGNPLSLFTLALIEGLAGAYLNDNESDVTVFDLAMYIRERVFPLSKKKQSPQLSIIENSNTENFIVARFPKGKPTKPIFNESFSLIDQNGKTIEPIDLLAPVEKDVEYRSLFSWFVSIGQVNNNINYVARDQNIYNVTQVMLNGSTEFLASPRRVGKYTKVPSKIEDKESTELLDTLTLLLERDVKVNNSNIKRIQHLVELYKIHESNLHAAEIAAAKFGELAPSILLHQISDNKKKIEELKTQIEALI